jgi:uncharacterized protein YjiS (DUF1127 family)
MIHASHLAASRFAAFRLTTRRLVGIEVAALAIAGALQRFHDQLAAWQRRRRSRHDLASLAPHLRRDIGLGTLDVWCESGKPFSLD